jgi:hypothetical protein
MLAAGVVAGGVSQVGGWSSCYVLVGAQFVMAPRWSRNEGHVEWAKWYWVAGVGEEGDSSLEAAVRYGNNVTCAYTDIFPLPECTVNSR